MFNPWKPLRRALLPMAAFGLFACQGERSPVSPSEDAAPTLMRINGVNLVTVAPSRPLSPASWNSQQLVRKNSGATLTTEDVTFMVQPGSMSQENAVIMIEALDASGLVAFKFGPSGLQFDPPATLTMSAAKANLDGIDPAQLKIAGASDDVDDWQVVGGTYDPVTHTVTVPISHFSRYALCVE